PILTLFRFCLCDHLALLSSFVAVYFTGPHCNRTWDGWLCWEDSPAGTTVVQLCPDYYQDFDPTGNLFFSLCPYDFFLDAIHLHISLF
uniref:G-protein coupled receptors family 2 profile 1 domain-containing protein n=1 Tax=Erpetoichthys calabaricus TaxID=27687 RepID=A0A8C4T824_ERPCA